MEVKSKPRVLLILMFISCKWWHKLSSRPNDHCCTLLYHSVTCKMSDKLPWDWNVLIKYGNSASFKHNKNVNGCNLLMSWWPYLLIMCNASLSSLCTTDVNDSLESNKRNSTALQGAFRGKSSNVWITSRDGFVVYSLSHRSALIDYYNCYTWIWELLVSSSFDFEHFLLLTFAVLFLLLLLLICFFASVVVVDVVFVTVMFSSVLLFFVLFVILLLFLLLLMFLSSNSICYNK